MIDTLTASGLDYASPCIHGFRMAYSSGKNTDWPLHNTTDTNGNTMYSGVMAKNPN